MKLIIHTDGGSRGNPGPAAAGVVLLDAESRRPVHEAGYFLGSTTNNVAEYSGLIRALEQAIQLGATAVEVRCDSELVVKQVRGEYRVKHPQLRPLHGQVLSLSRRFEVFDIKHVYREHNTRADELANRAMDQRKDIVATGSGPTAPSPAAAAPTAAPVPAFTAMLDGKAGRCLVGLGTGNEYAFGPTTPEGFCIHAAAAALAEGPLQWPPSRRDGDARCRACGLTVKLRRLA